MHGVFISNRRPSSKKEIKEVMATNPERVTFENTSMHGGSDYDGTNVPDGLTFVGPDPYKKRAFYGAISRKGERVTVK